MKIYLENNKAKITFDDVIEYNTFVNAMSWYDKKSGETSYLFWEDQGIVYSFRGVAKYLDTFYREKFSIEVVNDGFYEDNISLTVEDLPKFEGMEFADFQVKGIEAAINKKRGIVVCPTSSGKTEMMLAMFLYLLETGKVKSGIFIVTSSQLLQNFQTRAIQRGIKDSDIGIISGKKKQLSGKKLYISMPKTMFNLFLKKDEKLIDLVSNVGMIAWDEGHHVRSMTSSSIYLSTGKAEYNVCFTGSPFGSDDIVKSYSDSAVFCITGGPIYKIGYDVVYDSGLTSKPYYTMVGVSGKMSKTRAPYNNVYNKYVLNNEERNNTAVNICKWLVGNNISVLVLIQRLDHAYKLMTMLGSEKVICVFGGGIVLKYANNQIFKEKADYGGIKQDYIDGKYNIIIGSQVLDEGFDLASIGSVIMLGAGKSKIQFMQRIGRGLRKKTTGKNVVYIFDFLDFTHVFLHSQSIKRKNTYKEIGVDHMEVNAMKAMIETNSSIQIKDNEEMFNCVKDACYELAKLRFLFKQKRVSIGEFNSNMDEIKLIRSALDVILGKIELEYSYNEGV